MTSIIMTTTTTTRTPVIRSLGQVPAEQENSWRTGKLRLSPNQVMACVLCTTVSWNSNISGAVNTIAVLDMINSLQEEIKDINAEIEKENDKIEKLKRKKMSGDSDHLLAAKVSTEETVKELNLQKEDTTMKKVMAQMMLMKKIQKKKEENNKLELALRKLSERRKLINEALRKQKEVASEKRFEVRNLIHFLIQNKLMKD